MWLPSDVRTTDEMLIRPAAAIACDGTCELRHPILATRPEVPNPLRGQEAFDAPNMLDPLLHQELALTMETLGILFSN